MNPETIEGGYYYDLWKFFNEEHNLILVDSEIQDIIHAVAKFQNKELQECKAEVEKDRNMPLPKQDPVPQYPSKENGYNRGNSKNWLGDDFPYVPGDPAY